MEWILYSIYLLLLLINMFYSITGCKNRFILFVTYLFIMFLFVSNSGLFGDAANYKYAFLCTEWGDTWLEPGFGLFQNLCHFVGIESYNVFLSALYLVASIFYYWGFKKLSLSLHPLFAVSMIFIVPTLCEAIRFFFALSIVVFSLSFLIKGKHFKYILGIVIASTFHKSVIFFLILLLGNIKGFSSNVFRLNVKQKILILASLFMTALVLLGNTELIQNVLALCSSKFLSVDQNKLFAYFSTVTRFGGFIFYFIYILGLLFVCSMVREISIFITPSLIDTGPFIALKNINLIMCMCLPIIALNLVFYRELILLSLINACAYSYYVEYKKNYYKKNYLFFTKTDLYFILYCLSWEIPDFLKIHSISISGLIKSSYLFT